MVVVSRHNWAMTNQSSRVWRHLGRLLAWGMVVSCCVVAGLADASGPGVAAGCDPGTASTCTLRELASLAGIRMGATAEPGETIDPDYSTTLAREFNALTPENAMKWYTTQPSPGAWNFEPAETVVDFALEHGMAVRGHTLVWAQDTFTPTWVKAIADPDDLRAVVEEQITKTMTRFEGRVRRWDVVNEPLESLGTGPSASVFWNLGPDWIADAFTVAHAVDPDAELWINEYGTDWVPGKHAAFVQLVTDLVNSGAPVDGVGIQTHRLPGGTLDEAAFAAQLRDFAALGLDVAITELDVPVSPTDPNAFSFQAGEYRKIMAACLAVTRCVEVTTWGLTDRSTWLDGLGLFPTPTRPLLFDENYAPKPAYDSTRLALANAVTGRCRVTTPSLPSGRVGVPYSTTLAATGGTAPYKWKKLVKLPKRLKLKANTGVISGTPTVAGTYTIRVQILDKAKRPRCTAARSYTLEIA